MEKIDNTLKKYNLSKDALKRSFNEAKGNKEFIALIERLDIKEEELMKNTTKLEETTAELSNCKGCKGLINCRNKVNGYIYYPEMYENTLKFSYKACKYEKERLTRTKYLKNTFYFDEPEKIKTAAMKDIDTKDKNRVKVIKYLDEFITGYKEKKELKGLYLHGSFGSGKTFLLAAMLNELAKSNYRIAIIYFPEFLRDLKSSFDTDFKEKFEYIKKVPLLLLDDIGAENATPWGRDEILGPILQYRMEQNLKTFFTSNLTKEELENHFAATKDKTDKLKARRIMERINQLTTELELVSNNRR